MALTTMFSFQRAHPESVAAAQRASFASATPFPYVVLDGLLPEEVIDALNAEFPEPDDAMWQESNRATEVKLALRDTANHGHPNPLACPETRAGRSLALYHDTNGESISTSARDRLRRCVPPALVDLAHARRR